MAKPSRTTIEITETVKPEYERMSRRYGIRTAVSAGLLLLDQLSAEEREDLVDYVNGALDERPAFAGKSSAKRLTLREALKEAGRKGKKKPGPGGMVIHIESSDEQAWEELRQIASSARKTDTPQKGKIASA